MEEFKEESRYVETDPTGRYGRVSSKILCFSSVSCCMCYIYIIQVLVCYLCESHKYVVLQGTCFFSFHF